MTTYSFLQTNIKWPKSRGDRKGGVPFSFILKAFCFGLESREKKRDPLTNLLSRARKTDE